VLKACIKARAGLAKHTTEHVRARLPKIYTRELVDVIFEQPYCRISNLVDKGIAQRQAASRYLHDLASLGVLREMPLGKEKLFIHPKLMLLLSRDGNRFEPYSSLTPDNAQSARHLHLAAQPRSLLRRRLALQALHVEPHAL
jgi:hypothetical protein